MHIFSYVFYTLSKIYRAGLAKSVPDVYACGLLSCIQMFNIMTIISISWGNKYLKTYGLGVSIIVFIINSILFNSKSLKKFDERWDNEPKPQRIFKRALVLVYIAATVAGVIYIVV